MSKARRRYDWMEEEVTQSEPVDTSSMVEEFLAKGGEVTQCADGNLYYKASVILSGCKDRALKKKFPYNLNKEWFVERVEKGICEATGMPIGYSYKGKATPSSPSVDRIDNTKGYTKDNCWVVSWAFNRAKNSLSNKALIELAEKIVENKEEILRRSGEEKC